MTFSKNPFGLLTLGKSYSKKEHNGMKLAFAPPKQHNSKCCSFSTDPFKVLAAFLIHWRGLGISPVMLSASSACACGCMSNDVKVGGVSEIAPQPPPLGKCRSWHTNPSMLLLRTCVLRWGCLAVFFLLWVQALRECGA